VGRRHAALAGLILLGLFATPPTAGQEGDLEIRSVMIPTGFQDGRYSIMIQVAMDGSPLPDATWEVDAALASAGRPDQTFHGDMRVEEPEVPVVFEIPVQVQPGGYELTLSVQERTAGQHGSAQTGGRWLDPAQSTALVSPIVLLQPARAAFARGESTRVQGALAVAEDAAVRTQLPTALVCVVCRELRISDPVRVERSLLGTTRTVLETIRLQPGEEPCAQVRDLIEPGTLGAGFFRYEVRVIRGETVIGSGTREFETVADGPRF
jgi:hypothetical protein